MVTSFAKSRSLTLILPSVASHWLWTTLSYVHSMKVLKNARIQPCFTPEITGKSQDFTMWFMMYRVKNLTIDVGCKQTKPELRTALNNGGKRRDVVNWICRRECGFLQSGEPQKMGFDMSRKDECKHFVWYVKQCNASIAAFHMFPFFPFTSWKLVCLKALNTKLSFHTIASHYPEHMWDLPILR